MENPKVTFELTTPVYIVLSNALTQYEADERKDLENAIEDGRPHLEGDVERLELINTMITQLENAIYGVES